nr:ATP-binding protein [uncultured Desulfobacter sp.]
MKRLLIYLYLFMMAVFLLINFCVSPLYWQIVTKNLEHQYGLFWADLTKGFFHVIEAELNRVPVENWDASIKEMQSHFVFPLSIEPIASMQLTESERSVLANGEIWVKNAPGAFFKKQMSDSGLVLIMGPMPDFEFNKFLLDLLFSLVIALIFFLFALLVVWPYAKKLRRIGIAAEAFGRGKLDARADLPPRSSLAHLANAFNSMADRIQELICSHKELTHAVSHELRTPLARLRFSMEMISSAGKDEFDKREKYLDGMRHDVDELDLLISEMLTYAKLDKSYRPQMEQIDLGLWLTELVAVLVAENPNSIIEYRNGSTDPKLILMASPQFLELALRNLVQNAVRYSNSRIRITLKTVDDQVVVHVDDDGPGIPPADRQRIFEPFVQLDPHSNPDLSGYGFGLAIVRRVAIWHAGRVTVCEAPMGGARFSLMLPIV